MVPSNIFIDTEWPYHGCQSSAIIATHLYQSKLKKYVLMIPNYSESINV